MAKYRRISWIAQMVVAVIVLIAVLIHGLTSGTRYVTLVANHDISDIVLMATELGNEGLRHRVTSNGTVLQVDESQLNEARAIIISRDLRPNVFFWENAVDLSELSVDARRIINILAVESEIENQLMQIGGVESALVALNIPSPSHESRYDTPPVAAVSLITTKEFTRDEGHRMALVVTDSVPGLELEYVHIINQYAQTIFSGADIGEEN